ncbi:FBXO21 [Symbiodinium necroappetens]|uniref:FBXO21 protein n=1 Tax=Symbiodinium necroappetens TaxID=1628268 RepID=A0A812KXS4_9DINO|nr:FBXO21 [Symbiodinium necroappetens]
MGKGHHKQEELLAKMFKCGCRAVAAARGVDYGQHLLGGPSLSQWVEGDLHNNLSLPLLDSQAQASVVQASDLQVVWEAMAVAVPSLPAPTAAGKPDFHTLVLSCNRDGMEALRKGQSKAAFEQFKYAEAVLIANQAESGTSLAAVTCNNLGCYYKKVGKLHGALSYLRRALQMEVDLGTDEVTLAGTHLNICAILSKLEKHDKAVQHALQALELIDRKTSTADPADVSADDFSVLAIAYHNVAVERDLLQQYDKAAAAFFQGFQVAKRCLGEDHPLAVTLGKNAEAVLLKSQRMTKVSSATATARKPVKDADLERFTAGMTDSPSLPAVPSAKPEAEIEEDPSMTQRTIRQDAAEWVRSEILNTGPLQRGQTTARTLQRKVHGRALRSRLWDQQRCFAAAFARVPAMAQLLPRALGASGHAGPLGHSTLAARPVNLEVQCFKQAMPHPAVWAGATCLLRSAHSRHWRCKLASKGADREGVRDDVNLEKLLAALQGSWEDDVGLSISVTGTDVNFGDGSGPWEVKAKGSCLYLRGTRFIGSAEAPAWEFPNGVQRTWSRPEPLSAEQENWRELFLEYKAGRLQLRRQLWASLVVEDSSIAELQELWDSGNVPGDGADYSLEQQARLSAGSGYPQLSCTQSGVRNGLASSTDATDIEPLSSAVSRGAMPGRSDLGTSAEVCKVFQACPGASCSPSITAAWLMFHDVAWTVAERAGLVDERVSWKQRELLSSRLGLGALPCRYSWIASPTEDRPGAQMTFVGEENVTPATEEFEIQHPLVKTLLIRCDELSSYLPSPQLEQALKKQRQGQAFQWSLGMHTL